jgi:protein-S-isoprenylcysteine O-methyltransferase Ste14
MTAAIALVLVLKAVIAFPAITDVWVRAIGGHVLGVGIALDLWAILTMKRAHTNILPRRSADRFVTWGPFSLTRNPIYVGNALSMLGAGLCFENLWFVLIGLVGAIVVKRLAIRQEELHLAILFGETWAEYTLRVPRWLMKQTGAGPKVRRAMD